MTWIILKIIAFASAAASVAAGKSPFVVSRSEPAKLESPASDPLFKIDLLNGNNVSVTRTQGANLTEGKGQIQSRQSFANDKIRDGENLMEKIDPLVTSGFLFSSARRKGDTLDLLVETEKANGMIGRKAPERKHIYLGAPLFPFIFKESRIYVGDSRSSFASETLRSGENSDERSQQGENFPSSRSGQRGKLFFLSPVSFTPHPDFEKEFDETEEMEGKFSP